MHRQPKSKSSHILFALLTPPPTTTTATATMPYAHKQAPEIMSMKPSGDGGSGSGTISKVTAYGTAVDVYSLGVLMCEIWTR